MTATSTPACHRVLSLLTPRSGEAVEGQVAAAIRWRRLSGPEDVIYRSEGGVCIAAKHGENELDRNELHGQPLQALDAWHRTMLVGQIAAYGSSRACYYASSCARLSTLHLLSAAYHSLPCGCCAQNKVVVVSHRCVVRCFLSCLCVVALTYNIGCRLARGFAGHKSRIAACHCVSYR